MLIGDADEIPFIQWQAGKSANPKHDERFEVTIVTEGTFEEAKAGKTQTGRTVVKTLPAGTEGVRIPRGVDVERFWEEIEACIERADEVNKRNGREFWEEYKP